MAEKIQIEIWVVMNGDGEYAVSPDRDGAIEHFDEYFTGDAQRVVKLNVWIAPPEVIEAEVTVDDDAGTVTQES